MATTGASKKRRTDMGRRLMKADVPPTSIGDVALLTQLDGSTRHARSGSTLLGEGCAGYRAAGPVPGVSGCGVSGGSLRIIRGTVTRR